MAPRLIRRRPLLERIKAYLDPIDFLLWLSEELDPSDWDQWSREWATPVGILLNAVFLIARANSGYSTRGSMDDVFGDDVAYTSWWSWFASFIVHLLSLLSFANAAYAFYRSRHYRLFESPVDIVPSTPSAHQVRVDSSPVASSPLRFLSKMIAGDNAEARSHPDATRDVWEVAVWDPTPISLRIFCLLSPGHVFVYWLFLPTTISDARPSVTVFKTVVLAALLSAQLLLLSSSFSQQTKDASVIQKEVMNEYDTKYVHPRTQPLMRDVGTQISSRRHTHGGLPRYDEPDESVDTYTPTVVINRGFQTRPNPNYAQHVDPQGSSYCSASSRAQPNPLAVPVRTPAHLRDVSSPLRPQTAIRQPQFRSTSAGDGGSLGVYTHTDSPLRNSVARKGGGQVGFRERSLSPQKRENSPLKKGSLAPTVNGYRAIHPKPSQSRREPRYE